MSTFQKVLAWLGGGVALLVVYYYWHMLGVTNSREIYLVPAGYRGIVYILFDQPAGAPPEHEGFKRLYRIPRTGLLRTQFGAQYGMNGLPQFFWDSSGYRRPLPYHIRPGGHRMPQGAYVSTLEFGKGGCTIEGQESNTTPTQYESFIVCEDQDLNKYYDQLRQHLHTPPELICKISALGENDSVEVFLD